MKKWILLIVLAIIGVLSWYFFVTKKAPKEEGPKQQPLSVSKHTDSFNVAVNKVLTSYYALTNDFVNWDSVAVSNHATELKANLEAVNFDELKNCFNLNSESLEIDPSKQNLFNCLVSWVFNHKDKPSKNDSPKFKSFEMYRLIVKKDEKIRSEAKLKLLVYCLSRYHQCYYFVFI